MIVLLFCELHIPHSERSVNMRPNARLIWLMRLIYHLCSSLYEHRIFIPPPKLPPLHFLSPLSRSHGAGTRVSYLVYNLTLDIWEHSLFWCLHYNCLLLGENYLLLTCVPIHETVSGNPILLGGSDGPNLLKLVCVVASPRPNTELEKSLVWSLISPLINLFLNYPESCWQTVNTSLIFHLSDGGWIRFSWDRWERENLGRELDWME